MSDCKAPAGSTLRSSNMLCLYFRNFSGIDLSIDCHTPEKSYSTSIKKMLSTRSYVAVLILQKVFHKKFEFVTHHGSFEIAHFFNVS